MGKKVCRREGTEHFRTRETLVNERRREVIVPDCHIENEINP